MLQMRRGSGGLKRRLGWYSGRRRSRATARGRPRLIMINSKPHCLILYLLQRYSVVIITLIILDQVIHDVVIV